jgi:hypothetical protein
MAIELSKLTLDRIHRLAFNRCVLFVIYYTIYFRRVYNWN